MKPRFPRTPINRPKVRRANYLQHPQQQLLHDWGRQLRRMFPDEIPYLVGSSIQRPDFRDVDVRMMLDDDKVDALPCEVRYFNLVVSLWGQQVTGLPIDFQIQRVSAANDEYGSRPRHALGIGI